MAISFPNIDPIAIAIGPLHIRWYALSYLAGFLIGWWVALRLNRLYDGNALPKAKIDDFIMWVVLGVIGGGRLGYILFYNFDYYTQTPLDALKLWHGGMSFHGGATGVIIAIIAYARYHKINMFRLADIVCTVVPVGLFFGRIANFINAELYGRATHVPWAIIFPGSDGQPRHPSQLYEAATEGLLLFLVLFLLMRFQSIRNRPGIISAVFLAGYALCRFMIEFVREPDSQLGTLSLGLTMGQTLCLPMMLGAGLVLMIARTKWQRT